MTSKIDRIVALSVQLSAARTRVAHLEAELDRLVGGGTPLPKGDPRPGTVADEVLAWVADAARPVTLREVCEALPRHRGETIRMTLDRYARSGHLDRVAPATFAVHPPEGR